MTSIFNEETEKRIEFIYNNVFSEVLTIPEYMNQCIKSCGDIDNLNKWLTERELEINITMVAEIRGLLK